MSRNTPETPEGDKDNRNPGEPHTADAVPNVGAASADTHAEPDISLEFDVPAEAGYDGFGEPLREALEDRLAQSKKLAHIKVTVVFR